MGIPFTTQSGTRKIIERFGKFHHLADPGLGWLIMPCCCYENAVGTVNMRQQQLVCRCETKSKDNTFVSVEVSVQYKVLNDRVYESFYSLDDAVGQIRAYVYDVVRSEIPKVTLDNTFIMKEELSNKIKLILGDMMHKFGYEIVGAPVTDIDPAPQVKQAMNEINRAERMKQAASDEGEAKKILAIKAAEAEAAKIRIEAEAEADAKYAAGEGLARQRQAIVDGLQKSVQIFQEGVADINSHDIMDVILLTQYFDTMKDIGTSTTRGTNMVFMPHEPAQLGTLKNQIRTAIVQGSCASSMINNCDNEGNSRTKETRPHLPNQVKMN